VGEGDLVRAIIPQTAQNFQRGLFVHSLSEMRSLHIVEIDPSGSQGQGIVFVLHREQIGAIELFIVSPEASLYPAIVTLTPRRIAF
jgi:hypothetical protein